MYNSLSSIFFYTLWYLEQLPYQYKVLDSCHSYTRSSYRAYSFFYFQLLTIIWWLFSTCRENVFYSQLETFLLAVRNISICSQKNFWLQRAGRVKQYPIGIATRKPYEVLEEIKKTKKSTRKCKCTHCAWQSTDIHID